MATNQSFGGPVLAPDLLRKQYQLQNNQALAQQLMQSEAPQGQMVSGHYVAPSWTQQLASALRPVVGQQIMNKMPEQMADLQQAQQAQDMQRFSSLYGGGGQGSGGQGAMSPQDMWREFTVAQLMGMDKYAAERMKWNAPTNEQKNLGFLPENVRNQAIMAPLVNEMNQDGVQNVLGQNGQVQAFAVPGYSDIQAQNAGAVAGAQAGAQAQYDIVKVPMPDGSTQEMTRQQAADLYRSSQQGAAPAGQPVGEPSSGPGTQGAIGNTPSESTLEARAGLANLTGQFDQIETTINTILDHPGIEAGTGLSSFLPSVTDNARNFDALAEQLQGQVFLQAYESLKGGGVITDFEGAKAERALARAQQSQSKPAYESAIKEFLGVIQAAKKRAYEKAGVPMPEPGQSPPRAQPTPSAQYSREDMMAEARRRGLIK